MFQMNIYKSCQMRIQSLLTAGRLAGLLVLLHLALSNYSYAQTRGQEKNYVTIDPGDKETDIIRKAATVVPSPRQFRWQQLELTAFLHFGINTFTNREWGDGKEDISRFNPTRLDAGQWVRVLKAAGFKQVIVTAKHHDGFCLWPSKYTEHSIKNTPYMHGKGDVVKAVADACKAQGVGFGVYLSPWDRNSLFYGDSAKYNTHFMHQLTELLSNYGKVDEVWFDGANGEGPNGKKQVYNFDAWYALIRRLQPGAVIAIMGPDVRWVGTESGYGRETEWSVIPADRNMLAKIAAGSQQDIAFAPVGDKTAEDLGSREKIRNASALVWYPAETDVSIRPGWFYHPEEDRKVKTPDKLMDIYFNSVGRNGVLLLNVPPDTNGLISQSDVRSLQEWKVKFDRTFSVDYAKGAVKKIISPFIIELDLKRTATFNVLCLQENIRSGQRVEQFTAEYWDGHDWKKLATGTTIGYKRLLKFDAVTTGKIRLNIGSSRLTPELTAIGAYRLAE